MCPFTEWTWHVHWVCPIHIIAQHALNLLLIARCFGRLTSDQAPGKLGHLAFRLLSVLWICCSLFLAALRLRLVNKSDQNQWRIQDLWKGRAGNPNSAMPRQAWKSRSEGGRGGGRELRHIFLCASFTLLARGTVRLPDRPPGRGDKRIKNEKKKKN